MRKSLDEEMQMDDICERIRNSAHKLLPLDKNDQIPLDENDQILDSQSQHNNNHSPQQPQPLVNMTPDRLESLPDSLERCLVSLLIFPKDAVLNKRHTIYWWIGNGCVGERKEKTAEEVGEEVIDELLKLNLIRPYHPFANVNANSPLLNKFQIHSHICSHFLESLPMEKQNLQRIGFHFGFSYLINCLVLEQQKVTLGVEVGSKLYPPIHIHSVFNVGASYLNFESQWLPKQEKNLRVIQLGRWQDSPSHHIEVGSQEFLKDLRNMPDLWYLSLRGISRISELPPSIAQLERLKILDLKACHNLETMPDDISSMKRLTHLILSQCYLLDSMPNGIEKLTNLQVLKGFLISTSSNTPCRISDLAANLKELRRLGIHTATEAVIKDGEFERLKELPALKHLKISWGVSKYSNIQIILPSSLKRLHLEGFPGQKIPEWLNPSMLDRGFKELKLTGGKLESLNHEDDDVNKWGMEIVRLKYLKHLNIHLENLKELFPLLRFAEIKKDKKEKPSYFAI